MARVVTCFLSFILLELVVCSTNLYENDPNVATLTDENFEDNVLKKDYFIYTIFYAHWCGHCQAFAPKVKQFAEETSGWQRVLRVAAIDCVENVKTCDGLMGITGYPTVVLFPPNQQHLTDLPKYLESDLLINGIQDLYNYALPKLMADTLITSRNKLSSIHLRDKNELCAIMDSSDPNKEQYVILEMSPSNFSAMIMLDLLNYHKQVEVRRFNVIPTTLNLFFDFPLNLPAILQAEPATCNFRIKLNNIQDLRYRHEFVNEIKEKEIKRDRTLLGSVGSTALPEPELLVRKHELSFVDLYNTLRYSCLKEIPRRKMINETQLAVLKEYFYVIHRYFPFDNENVRRLFKRMNIWLAARKKPVITSQSYVVAMKISDGFLKPHQHWRHCNGSKEYYRGYPCGMWSLFHTMTVNEYNMTKNDANPKHEVLKVMRKYIATFFSCEECAKHFALISANMESKLLYPNSSVMWLWETHNQVNYRLQGDVNEDPHFPKIQFPSTTSCERCRQTSNNEYNRTEVFNYLLYHYNKRTIKDNGSFGGRIAPQVALIVTLLFTTNLFALY